MSGARESLLTWVDFDTAVPPLGSDFLLDPYTVQYLGSKVSGVASSLVVGRPYQEERVLKGTEAWLYGFLGRVFWKC